MRSVDLKEWQETEVVPAIRFLKLKSLSVSFRLKAQPTGKDGGIILKLCIDDEKRKTPGTVRWLEFEDCFFLAEIPEENIAPESFPDIASDSFADFQRSLEVLLMSEAKLRVELEDEEEGQVKVNFELMIRNFITHATAPLEDLQDFLLTVGIPV